MTDELELFSVPRNETRLEKFKRENEVTCSLIRKLDGEPHEEPLENPWEAIGKHWRGYGKTEEDACLNIARKMGVALTL